MTSVITGDIINSNKSNPLVWLRLLKAELNNHGIKTLQWEVYRGDSFQLEVAPEKALEVAILIKATIKQLADIDVRMAIGIGEKDYNAKKITESNGSAFINSGRCFEQLKKHTLAIKSPWDSFDEQISIMIELALLVMNNWAPTSSVIIKAALNNPNLNQSELAKKLKRTQSNISAGLKRSGYDEIKKMLEYYSKNVITK